MTKQAGLWIDHKEAFIVFVGDNGEETRRVESGMDKHVRFSGGNRPEDGSADDQRDRQFSAHLNRYYDEVISHIGGATESCYLVRARQRESSKSALRARDALDALSALKQSTR